LDASAALSAAFGLIVGLDPGFLGIVGLSLAVTLTAVVIAALVGLPLGALLALARFPGRSVVVVLVNALMGLPPVVAGLVIYLLLSRSGPLGGLGLLFTPTAMVAAQAVLVLPIVIALTRQIVADLHAEYREHLTSIGLTGRRAVPVLLWESRFALATAPLAASAGPALRSAPCSSSAPLALPAIAKGGRRSSEGP
jgi:tungstate transport system permease protein